MTDKAPDRISTYRGYVFVNQFKPGAVHWVRHDIHEDVFQMYLDANEARMALEAEMQKVALYWGDRATDAEAERDKLREAAWAEIEAFCVLEDSGQISARENLIVALGETEDD